MSTGTTSILTSSSTSLSVGATTGILTGNLVVNTLPPTLDHLEADQMLKVEDLLKQGKALTNFEIQRSLFGGNLNKEAALAIKRHLLNLVAQGKVEATGNKRGRRYTWIG